jgi:hypothetical protein
MTFPTFDWSPNFLCQSNDLPIAAQALATQTPEQEVDSDGDDRNRLDAAEAIWSITRTIGSPKSC